MRSYRFRLPLLVLAAVGLLLVHAIKEPSTAIRATAAEAADPQCDAPKPDEAVVAQYRAQGPQGLQTLFDELDPLLAHLEDARQGSGTPEQIASLEAQVERLERLIDAVGRQRYCSVSRLYWYTDWDQAKQAALQSGKPILSLRMLGNLDDELSCANSRFFRTTLYANAEISQHLREHFILHWKSVRPVPKVTIDFGDGRKLVRTVTGNSAHYVLTCTGHVVDVLPGLYGTRAFLEKLQTAETAARQLAPVHPSARPAALQAYHQQRLQALDAAWHHDLQRVGLTARTPGHPSAATSPSKPTTNAANPGQRGDPPADNAIPADSPPARAAAGLAVPKARIEMPLVAAITPPLPTPTEANDELWNAIAGLHRSETVLDRSTADLISREAPAATVAANVAVGKRAVESPLLRLLSKLRSSIALDTVRNEYLLHRQIHHWFASGTAPADLEALNERVYAELFLTPSSDPWLGLMPKDVYTALTNDGIVIEETKQP